METRCLIRKARRNCIPPNYIFRGLLINNLTQQQDIFIYFFLVKEPYNCQYQKGNFQIIKFLKNTQPPQNFDTSDGC